MQTMAAQLGGQVENSRVREFGYAEVRARGHSKLFDGIQDRINGEKHGLLDVWMSHGDKVTALPPGFKVIASNEATPIAGMADEARNFYGVQFHPEVTHTRKGSAILGRFVHEICRCDSDWNMPDYIMEAVEKIRREVGSEEVLLGLSGGVDSAVAAALIHRAIGAQLCCVFVDTGLLRLNEADEVMQTFSRNLGVKVDRVDASARFLGALAGISDPEEKRKIIGREFVEVFQAEAKKFPKVKWLAQGTIYPDVIESAGAKTKKAHTIKSHHNVGGLPETLHDRGGLARLGDMEDDYNLPYLGSPLWDRPFENLGSMTLRDWGEGASVLGSSSVWETALLGAGAVLVSAALDRSVSGYVDRHQGSRALDTLDGIGKWLPFAALGGAGLAALSEQDKRSSNTGIAAIQAGATGLVASEAIKYTVGRARPVDGQGPADFEPFQRSDASFPSNHATVAWATLTPFATEYDAPWLYGVAALVNAGRIASREHWLSDTVASSLLGYWIGDFFWQERRRTPADKGPKVAVGPSSVSLIWETK